MAAFKPNLPAKEADCRLREALSELRQAKQNAVLWFAEVLRRKLYRELGYSSMHQYAGLALGFSKSKTSQFVRLSESLRELPALRRSVARGELPWTKAREVAKVASRETEKQWIRKARRVSRRELEGTVRETRKRARKAGLDPGQVSMDMTDASREAPGKVNGTPIEAAPVPLDIHLRMSAEQYGRYQALLQALMKRGVKGDRTELLLAGLEQLVLGSDATTGSAKEASLAKGTQQAKEFTRVNSRSPYQVVVHQCPDCGSGRITTNRGERKLTPTELRTILCDAHRRRPGKRNQAAVPDRLRRAVLERDRYCCRAAGCGRTGFLAVHHLAPRERGGANRMENLITLCSGCHRALHASGGTDHGIQDILTNKGNPDCLGVSHLVGRRLQPAGHHPG